MDNIEQKTRKSFTKDQINQARARSIASLLGIEERGRYQSMPCPMCGGHDRFQINLSENVWICRQCGNGKYENVIDFIMKRDNLQFIDAVATLLNSPTLSPSRPIAIPKRNQPKPPSNFIEQCRMQYSALYRDKDVLGYATGRALSIETLKRFLCGTFTNGYGSKGLTFPYFTEDKQSVSAVRYRLLKPFTNKNGKLTKTLFLKNSSTVIPFGLQALTGRDSLVIVEGEVNAMSIAQSSDADVLSFGSESIRADSKQFTIICDVAERYKHVSIWCDKPEVSQRLGRAILCADLRQSPNGKDANDLLQSGQLSQFLDRILPISVSISDRPNCGDILITNTGCTVIVQHVYEDGLIAGLEQGLSDPCYSQPYRLINGRAHQVNPTTGMVE